MIDQEAKCRALAATSDGGGPLLNGAMLTPQRWLARDSHTAAMKAYVNTILAAPEQVLSSEAKFELLLSRTNFNVPMLSDVCGKKVEPPLKQHTFEYAQIREFILAIANSDLDDALKQSLFASVDESSGSDSSSDSDSDLDSDEDSNRVVTAAQRAMKSGNLGAAAAMLLGILGSDASATRKTAWTAQLGVDPLQVIAAFSGAAHHPADRDWAKQIVAEIRRHID